MRLLLIKDDPILGEGLRDFLLTENYAVDWCQNLKQTQNLKTTLYDALLIDWQLPDGSGLQWLRARRASGDATPAVMLTARDLLTDRIQGLDAGADDYLIKPFEPEELSARLRAMARRSAHALTSSVSLGDVNVDLSGKNCSVREQRIDLTAREWAVLEVLLRRRGRIVPKLQMESLVMGYESDIHSNVLEVHISSLRRKLGRELIETVRGLGYRIG